MKKLFNTYCCLFLILISSWCYGQEAPFDYKRKIKGANEGFQKIILPDEIFSNLKPDLSDLRIIGIKESGDTVMTPFILKELENQVVEKTVDFNQLNSSRRGDTYFYTLEIPDRQEINTILLDFGIDNFDWEVKLEGSQDLDEWFSILETSRVVSIKNTWTNYSFTSLSFPRSRYRYYRFSLPNKEHPAFTGARMIIKDTVSGRQRNYSITDKKLTAKKQEKQTVIDLSLSQKVPVSQVSIDVKDQIDFYRPIVIQYLSDSVKSEKGWKYFYNTIATGVLSSLEKNDFQFSSIVTSRLKIIIENQDNEPLAFGGFELKGNVFEIIARFNQAAEHYLLYGNPEAQKPVFDLAKFQDKIPGDLEEAMLGEEQKIEHEASVQSPLFENPWWLWGIMAAIMVVLAWFSLKMIRKA